MRNTRGLPGIIVIVIALIITLAPLPGIKRLSVPSAIAAGYIDFEDGIDGQPIRSTIPGLQFTTTNGQDWLYGDWRTGRYNGKYPRGAYSSNGNFFAWLGPSQGFGRIDFTDDDGATYISFGVSTANYVEVAGYNRDGIRIAFERFNRSNLNTGYTNEIRLNAPAGQRLSYVIISGRANYWLIDDLSTDAAGVPDSRIPLIFLPGIAGSRLRNHNGEVWPNGATLLFDGEDNALRVLRLNEAGNGPLHPNDPDYNTIAVGDIIRSELSQDVYSSLIGYLNTRGYSEDTGTLTVVPYDWRKDLVTVVDQLDAVIANVKARTGAAKVNLLAHSMGGLVARAYIADATRAANVETLVTLGTPYLGAPKAFVALHYGTCLVNLGSLCFSNERRIQEISQNSPAIYQLLPSRAYFTVYPDGYFQRDWDSDGRNGNDGWLSYEDISELIKDSHNRELVNRAAEFHRTIDGYAQGANGVRVYAFVGMSNGTIVSIREYQRRKWHWVGRIEAVHDLQQGNGDGTVPLHSADMGRNRRTGDLSGSVSYFYTPLEHGELAKYNNGRTVLRLVGDILEVRAAPRSFQMPVRAGEPAATAETTELPTLLRAPSLDQAGEFVAIETNPTPLAGRQLLLNGAASLSVVDAQGRVVRITATGAQELGIPGASLHQVGASTSIFLPEGGAYTITVRGHAMDVVDLRLRTVISDNVAQTVIYKDIPLDSGSIATLDYPTTSTPTYQINLDKDGDGANDAVITPLAVLNASDSADTTPPVTTVSLQGARSPRGWFVGPVIATLEAVDEANGSGVARIEYSLDGGRTVNVYTGPITINNAEEVASITARAIDRAGNEEVFFVTSLIGPQRVFIPITRR